MQSLPINRRRFGTRSKLRNKYVLTFCVLLSCFTLKISAQNIPLSTWRTHLTYYNAQAMVKAKERIYVASENGFFYLDLTDNSLNTFSKEDGLSDINITSLAYDGSTETMVIGYGNGNIDLVKKNEIINIRSLFNSIAFADKEIRAITLFENQAFLATPFGVIVVDLLSPRIKETYLNIGENGSQNGVYDVAIVQDSIFLATEQGLWAASLGNSVNRLDFANWRAAVKGNGVRHLAVLAEQLFFTVQQDGLFKYLGGASQVASFGRGQTYRGLAESENQLILLAEQTLYITNEKLNAEVRTGEKIKKPIEAFFDAQNTLWVADTSLGLVKFEGNNAETLFPSGPFEPAVFRLKNFGSQIVAVAGGVNEQLGLPLNKAGSFYVFEQGKWSSYASVENAVGALQIPTTTDISSVAATFDNKVYLGSFGNGLLEWEIQGNTFKLIKAPPLTNRPNFGITIGGLATDQNGSLWISNYAVATGSASIHSLNQSGQWLSFQFGSFASRFPREILIDDFEQKWVRLSGAGASGILVFENESNFRFLGEGVGNGDLPSSTINCFAKDRNGSIWVGTDRGVAEFFDPFSILNNKASDAVFPRFEGLPLLRDENVTSIAVDGGNRKWIGTKNGVWLFSAEGSQLIHHFTEKNSPLLADIIVDIAIQPISGEVFFGTNKGIVSYRSDATIAPLQHENVKIFPNPVRPNFQGVVSISGLVEDAIVKIADISGKMIWETRAKGGTATWDTFDYNGKKAKTGVYLVFSVSLNGEQTFVGKFAVVE